MIDSDVVQRFRGLESEIAAERGGFSLFALFMREEVPDRWDLIVAAPWIGAERQAALEYIVGQIKSKLGSTDLTSLSRIVVLNPEDSAVQALNQALNIEHGVTEIRDSSFFGLAVKHAFIITSKRVDTPDTGQSQTSTVT